MYKTTLDHLLDHMDREVDYNELGDILLHFLDTTPDLEEKFKEFLKKEYPIEKPTKTIEELTEFVNAWQSSNSRDEVAQKLQTNINFVIYEENKLRGLGIKLKYIP